MEQERQAQFRRNPALEDLLKELNGLLAPVERQVLQRFTMPQYPVVFVIGAPRCGTTVTTQWLASSGRFGYPSNMLSRFYDAPYLGAKIQRLFADPLYNFNDEILDFSGAIEFESALGKTRGALAPNEFFYFWRRFIPKAVPEHLTDEEIGAIDGSLLTAELAAMEAAFDKPIALKGAYLQFNIAALSPIFDKALFVYVKRHPFYNMQSVLESRVKFYGDREAWYSVKPKEYEALKGLDPFAQVAGQVYYTNCAIERGLAELDEARWLFVPYERFCRDPAGFYDELADKLAAQGCAIRRAYPGPPAFTATNQVRVTPEEQQRLLAAYRDITGEDVAPLDR
ncbi:MAG: sulfotransferase [Candidatus Hydrogenedentes bacterium]|nr:sulfotransferase [Candidatus Hydrogenedentota bacterium]